MESPACLSLLRGRLGLLGLILVLDAWVYRGPRGRTVAVARAHLGERQQGVGEVWWSGWSVARCHHLAPRNRAKLVF